MPIRQAPPVEWPRHQVASARERLAQRASQAKALEVKFLKASLAWAGIL